MEVGLVGKPNVGKSTFFAACTLATAEIANYPFTTIEANRGVAHVRAPCPHEELGLDGCDPGNATCIDGTRFVPVEVIDVAGLVPDAHEGKGLGNKFLNDLSRAAALVHVVDATGATDAEGNPVDPGTHDPRDDVAFLEDEVDHWIAGILGRGFDRVARAIELQGEKVSVAVAERLTGLGIDEHDVHHAIRRAGIDPEKPGSWGDEGLLALAREVRAESKPFLVAANKADAASDEQLQELQGLPDHAVVPVAAESELALRRAAEAEAVRYRPGDDSFEVTDPDALSDPQRKALDYVRHHVFDRFGGTGVQQVLEDAVYEVLDRIVVFPVEDETHYTDKEGRRLPDAILLPRGSTARDLAYAVHTDLGESFIRAVDARTQRVIGADHELEPSDVVRIVADA